MSLALTLPLVGLLIGLPGIPGLSKKLPKLRLPHKAVVDTLPPVWKPYSLLVLEDQFVFARLTPIGPKSTAFKVNNDPRRLEINVDPDSGTVSAVTAMGEVPVAGAARVPFAQYNRDLAWQSFSKAWTERSRQSVNTRSGPAVPLQRGGRQFALPVTLPKAYTSILGPGGPAINVSGSENIKLAGTSEWSNQQSYTGQRRSLFPSLDMEQDLDIRLEGQLSDRVKVNLLQNSATQIPLANKIAINYKGDEDDLVQSLDLGNTNLSLPGTQYVSYSGRNEGLFGMKATTRLGPLDFTMLASKQEGKSERASYAGGASRGTQTLNDYDYVRGVYFLLYDPNFETQDIDQSSIRLYLDDGTNYASRVNAIRGRAFVDPRTARLDSIGIQRGEYEPSARGFFSLLTQGAENDYEILNDVYGPLYRVIRLKRAIEGDEPRLAVTYAYRSVVNGQPVGDVQTIGGADTLDTDGATSRTMKLLRAPLDLLVARPDGYFRSDTLMAATLELELRNFYNLNGQRIDPKSFTLAIRHGVDNPPVTYVSQANGEPVPYNEILGLDNFDESSGTPVYRKHDAKVDGTLPSSTSRLFVDYENGVLFFFDPRPFAPRIADDPTQAYPPQPFDQFQSRILFRRDSLVGAPDAPNERNRAIYDLRSSRRAADPIRPQVSRYYLDIEFTAARAGNEINLGRSNIIEGSEAVTINGRRLERDKDYTVDYDLGRVSLKAPPGAADQVSVDYSYAPLFQQAGRTLLGSAFRLEGRERHVGGAFLYESKGAQDLRPRLGEEPSRVLIGDLNAEWRTRPGFMTRWVDALPGVRTTAPSEFNVSAEMGASFPNPNTFNEVYVDDMEGVRDAVSLIMTPERWRWASMPSRKNPITGFADSIQSFQKNAEVHWFTPLNAVKERDLKPKLTDAQGAQNPRQTLAISVPRRPPAPWSAPGDSLWAGLTYLLDGRGLDLSRAQFIELWVNDFRDENKVPRTPGRVRLHIDLGRVSEDQRRSPAGPANRALDTEDLFPRDRKLDVTDVRNEDTGLDGVNDAGESATHDPAQEVADPSLITSGPNDPAGDDYRQPDVSNGDPRLNLDPYRWLYINGTEANKNVYPVPDTEDLNGDDNLALVEPNRGGDYFEYTIDLASSPYLADSVYAPGRTYANNGDPIPSDNGWRRYRIPISDSLRVQFGVPELLAVRHVRVWVEGITNADDVVNPAIGERRPLLLLGGLEIVGSRWLVTELTPGQNSSGTTVTLNSINNVDNADVYVPPFDPGSTRNGAQDLTRREQSLALEFTRLLPGDSLEAFKTFSLDENYSRYGTLRFYVAGFDLPGYDPAADSLSYFVRFASDERGINYYEYRAPVPRSSAPGGIDWSEVRLKLTELSNLKLDPQAIGRDTIIAPGSSPGVTLIVKGRPSFTRLRRISFGLVNRGPKVFPSGSVWLDELRATDVARDRGQAQRFGVTGRMSNLLNYAFNYNARDEDFLSVGETRGGGNRTNGYTATAGLELHRFFAGTGIVLPITLNLSGNRAQPRYTAGDDVLRTGALATASESRVNSRSYGVSYGRTWSERSNPLLRYTVGGISATLSQTRSENLSPSSVDTSRSTGATVNYSISPRRLLAVPLPGTKAKLWPLPERVFWNYSVGTTSSRTYDRLRDASGTLVLRNDSKGRTASIDFGADSRPFDILHHQFQARRNLTLPDRQLERIGFINLGRVVQWNQSMDSRYALNRGAWLRPQLNWSASYYQNNGPELSPSLGVKAISNSGVVSAAWTLPFDQLVSPARVAQPDTLHRGPAAWQSGLSHLGAVSFDASINRGSQYTRLSGIPSFPYFVGFSNDPGLSDGRMGAQFGNTSTQSQDFRTSGRTRLLLARGASVRTSAEFNTRRANTNGLVNRSRRVQFPNLDVDYGKLPEAIGLKRLLVNPSLRTTYVRNRTTDFSNSPTPTSISTSSEWRPLLRITGDLKNGTRAELGIQHRATESVYRQVGSSVTSEANTDVDLSLNRAYTKGQKVSFMGKTSAVKSNITLGFTAAYSRRKGETRQAGIDRPFNPVNEDRLNASARGSYGFSTNVTGNAELGYSQNRYLQQGNVRRSIRVELRAQFTF